MNTVQQDTYNCHLVSVVNNSICYSLR